jgi:hypothetical protein
MRVRQLVPKQHKPRNVLAQPVLARDLGQRHDCVGKQVMIR